METGTQFLLAIGAILLAGLATDALGRHTFLPRITLLLIFGIVIGEEGFDLIPEFFSARFEIITNMTLLMVGFLMGGMLTKKTFQQSGKKILSISISAAIVTTMIVSLALIAFGMPLEIAILLGCIASATDPAATVDTAIESGYRGNFSKILFAIVSLDDGWGLILFSLGMATVTVLNGSGDEYSFVLAAVHEIGGAVVLGLTVGLPAAYLTGRIKPGQPMLTEALGVVFVCGGLALWLEVSFLIAAMVLGATITNLAKHHEYPFHAIEGVEWPLMAIFFVLAGASLNLSHVKEIALIGVIYCVFRAVGKIGGAGFGAYLCSADQGTRRWMGMAMLPQAGAAMGMALMAAAEFPEYRQVLLSVVISSTIFFEIIGPIMTRIAIRRGAAVE
ncbi:sodium:proton antiporter [Candidatus Tenderia electrophaga]|jgi:Kef-type K+ transport system membrane component KefB|uniref:Sodium:proton antiporter n=1 Tax=Candidatus Tenderia electrophaga TaxID=1748243 RepID=A0A0S2TA66_9GAMM|nr:sodium:proton antiporter [Candidatus Tenderia electrophaga]